MEDLDFFDLMYQKWSKTTEAEEDYWMYEPDEHHYAGGPHTFAVYSVGQDQEKTFIASFEKDEDADFITAVHGCFPDLIRRLRDAIDESDRLDYRHDAQECRVAELEMENDELRSVIDSLSAQLDEATR